MSRTLDLLIFKDQKNRSRKSPQDLIYGNIYDETRFNVKILWEMDHRLKRCHGILNLSFSLFHTHAHTLSFSLPELNVKIIQTIKMVSIANVA